ncbi:3-methyladenine DNA glycosylase [Clostridium zeae]|uniref:DNA-3-methyladenine glycosylase II n=1 Tax=Clostridium zeae TaxID=2759022 RepID=A0ABQ1E447_9CLOT|nr:DNA-3-methyladenine glycosylase [Clostridium zeae]GFZ29509.1 3-methyladenine DNA glycosylase [Clostridium zeae]
MQSVRTKNFEYGEREIQYLRSVDENLEKAIDKLGKIERVVIPDLFAALIHAVVGQLISTKAVNTIWNRMQDRFGAITAENISKQDAEDIQACGITMKKANCIKDISKNIYDGNFNLEELYTLGDKEIIKRLSSLKGIGTWTAEMLLINCLERPDVMSFGDLAIRKGIMKLYNLSDLTKTQFEIYRKKFSPYGSVASIYLWKIAAISDL